MRTTFVALMFVLVTVNHVLAQEFPTRPIKILVPYQAGGLVDLSARVVAQKLQEEWKQPVVIENRPGASGMIAIKAAADSEPDGYTWLMTTTSEFTINPSILKNVSYDVLRDFNPITMIAESPLAIVTSKKSQFNSITDLRAQIGKQKAPLQYASTGHGSLNHLLAEWLGQTLDAKFQHIPYKGGAPAMTAVIAQEVQLGVLSFALSKPQAESGQLRILAISSSKRSPLAPEIPTLTEEEVAVAATIWVGLFTPKKVPQDINKKIHASVIAALQDSAVNQRLLAQGAEVKFMSPEEFSRQIVTEEEKFKGIIKRANITAE